MKTKLFIYLLGIVLISCKSNNSITKEESVYQGPKAYLALGDSYTIGEGVESDKNFPNQIYKQLKMDGLDVLPPKIIAKTGWRTDNLLQAIDTAQLSAPYDLVSLLIGVNNQYQGKNLDQLSREYKLLIDNAISLCRTGKKGLLLISIPDYSVTPFGKQKDPQKIRTEIANYNYIEEMIAKEYGLSFHNITPISQEASSNQNLVADDGLHPSAFMYTRWLKVIYDPALEAIKGN